MKRTLNLYSKNLRKIAGKTMRNTEIIEIIRQENITRKLENKQRWYRKTSKENA